MFKLNQRVRTIDGVGVIKTIAPFVSAVRYGVLLDIFPEKYESLDIADNILYYYEKEVENETR